HRPSIPPAPATHRSRPRAQPQRPGPARPRSAREAAALPINRNSPSLRRSLPPSWDRARAAARTPAVARAPAAAPVPTAAQAPAAAPAPSQPPPREQAESTLPAKAAGRPALPRESRPAVFHAAETAGVAAGLQREVERLGDQPPEPPAQRMRA